MRVHTDEILKEFGKILDDSQVIQARDAQFRYGSSTLGGKKRRVLGALLPKHTSEVVKIVKIASRYRTPLYPISRGRNWGYGSANPVIDGCFVVDLSGMNRILAIDKALGLVTVEPGVTFGQLEREIKLQNIPFWTPVTGGGASCSVLGNALERGITTGPFADHFGSMLSLEAVLPDGTIYRSAFRSDTFTSHSSGVFKWGIGPYLDGIFSQGNFGIVVNATFALAPGAEHTEALIVNLHDDASLESAIDEIRKSLHRFRGVMARVQIQNDRRIFSRLSIYPSDEFLQNGIISEAFMRERLNELSLSKWTIFAVFYGEKLIVRTAAKMVQKALRPYVARQFLFDERKLKFVESFLRYFPVTRQVRRYFAFLPLVRGFLNASTGKSFSVPKMPLWREKRSEDTIFDFDRNPKCGLMTFSGILPMKGHIVASFVDIAERICGENSIEPIISFGNFSDRCFFVSLQILFDKSSADSCRKAKSCYRRLFHESRKLGVNVYRTGIDEMSMIISEHTDFFKVVQKFKNTFDPLNIISPGRYSFKSKEGRSHSRGAFGGRA